MSNKYCRAGKCKCENFIVSNIVDNAPPFCHLAGESYYPIKHYEECPWPSRQVRVEPQGDCDKCPKDDAYAAGRLAGLQEAREAVAKVLSWKSNTSGIEWDCHRDDAIAAIDRLMEGE